MPMINDYEDACRTFADEEGDEEGTGLLVERDLPSLVNRYVKGTRHPRLWLWGGTYGATT